VLYDRAMSRSRLGIETLGAPAPGRMTAVGALVTLVACLAACPRERNGRAPDPAAADRPTLTIFGLAELRGQIEPCGCTTDPLGDLARTTEMIEAARAAGPVLVLDAGGTLYSQVPVPDFLADQEKLKSDLIVDAYQKRLGVAAIGLGQADLGMGVSAIRPARHAINVAADAGVPLEAPRLIEVGGVQVGVFGMIAPGLLRGIETSDPAPAAKATIADLRGRGARLIVALVQAQEPRAALDLVRSAPGIDLAIAGLGTNTPEPDKVSPTAYQVGDAWVVIPANRGQVISRIDVTLRPGQGPLIDAVGPGAAELLRQRLAARIEVLTAELASFEKSTDADPAFVAQKRQELLDVRAEDQALIKQPLRAPATGSYFALTQIKIKKSLACDLEVQDAKVAYSKAAGAANVAAAAGKVAPPPAKGQPGYVGAEACADCHAEADEFWQASKHFGAWDTLEAVGKQFDYECISCHLTGWDQPGGATLAANEPLRDVQCETCHGPGSIHVEKMGKDEPRTIRRAPADELCATQCHTPEHSDTFDRTAYLRDIVGPGHGEALRKTLGEGATGGQLRAAGLARAGKSLGAGCIK
jgi:hypothetical protein